MRLQSITLHPFGRFADQSWDLAKPLVVIQGPNELGKTTLRQAIFYALFTPTKQTDNQLKNSVKPWLPLPGGDHAHVTLAFEHDGKPWTLEKRWGAAQMSRLSDGTTAIADPAAVQQRLGVMLVHSEATYRHVLFTGQAELERTFVTIKDKQKAGELRDLRDLLQATADASADVDAQRLRQKLAEKIDDAFGRWDDVNGKPKPQGGREKGIADPWINGVGDILAAWYAWKKLLAERDRILELERQLDDIGTQAAALEDEIRRLQAFIEKYGALREELTERERLEELLPAMRREVAEMAAAFTAWPEAKAALKQWDQLRPTLDSQLQAAKQELVTAQARANAAALLKSFAAIKEAKNAWEKAVEVAKAHPHPGEDILREIDRLEDAITAAENKLAARSLSWRIEADEQSKANELPPLNSTTSRARIRVWLQPRESDRCHEERSSQQSRSLGSSARPSGLPQSNPPCETPRKRGSPSVPNLIGVKNGNPPKLGPPDKTKRSRRLGVGMDVSASRFCDDQGSVSARVKREPPRAQGPPPPG